MKNILALFINYWPANDPRLKTILAHKLVEEVPVAFDKFFIEELVDKNCYITGKSKFQGGIWYYEAVLKTSEHKIAKPGYLPKSNKEVSVILTELEDKGWGDIVHCRRYDLELSTLYKARYGF